MTRRDVLVRLALTVAAARVKGEGPVIDQRPALAAIDHLLVGAPDLDAAVAWFDAATGVRPAMGGSHPGVGTRNALVSLGERQYLEILAPDPAQSHSSFHIDVRTLPGPRLVTWAASTGDADAVARAAKEAGLEVFGPNDGSRKRPDGTTLRWRTVGARTDLATGHVDPVPFFIQWAAGARHPAGDSPRGCRLAAFELRHPDPERLRRTLAVMGLAAVPERAGTAALVAVLATPRGEVRLESMTG